MTSSATAASATPRNLGRSTGALALGFTTVVVLSLGTDEELHVLKVYPPWNEPIYDSRLCLLALSYRVVYTILGSYIAAKYAPHRPMGHAIALGVVGTVIGAVGAMATIPMHLGPAWYPIAIAATALPCAWLAGVLYRRWHTER